MKIAYIRPYQAEPAIVQAALPDYDINFASCVWDIPEPERNEITILSVFVDYQITVDVLAMLPNLKYIATRSAGYDHIDMSAVTERGIEVSRVPHYGTRTVAEYTIALLFALSRNAFRSYTDMQRHAGAADFAAYEGFDLAGKTLGVIGTGAIGRNVCEIARGIGMGVMAYDVQPDEQFAAEVGVWYTSLEELLEKSDIVTVHVPAILQTHHLLNQERLEMMKPGAYLINTARGEIVDTAALVRVLQSGHLAGAGLDVLEGEHQLREEADLLASGGGPSQVWETLVADHALIDMPNVIVTPHIAFNTVEAKREITDITVENIQSFAAGDPQRLVTV